MVRTIGVAMTAQEIGDAGLELARRFYRRMGYVQREGYRFDLATHPQERLCWEMACDAFDQIMGTDLNEVMNELND